MIKKLLLIEDSFTTQHVIQTAFEHDDIDVITTTTLAEALRKMQAVMPDVIVADASLPEADGFQLCHMIREMEGLQHIPVVLLTSGFGAYDEAQGERMGVAGHLSKPFEAHELRQLVQQVLIAPARSIPPSSQRLPQTPLPTPRSADIYEHTSRSQEEVGASASLPQQERHALTELEALMEQWSPIESSPAFLSDSAGSEALGRLMVQMICATLQTQFASILERLTPQILAAVQDIVTRKTPELLEALLQQEIDKLKRAVETDDRAGA
jgi:two-component system, OmpR family, response regulator